LIYPDLAEGPKPVPETCVVAIQLTDSIVKALEVCISEVGDVYVNYSMSGLPEAHASYHASGQQHIKKGDKYVEWNGGPTGNFEPMKLFRTPPGEVITRKDCGSTIGWEVAKLAGVLPVLTGAADMLVDARALREDSILAFKVEVIGQWARRRSSVSGFPVLQTHQFGGAVQVEVNVFAISETGSGVVWTEDF
jgi:hypothetical protein